MREVLHQRHATFGHFARPAAPDSLGTGANVDAMRPRLPTVAGVLGLAIALLSGIGRPLVAQPTTSVTESVDVRVVTVDVVVLDRKNRPVAGLGPDDFRLFEDGKEVAISNFSTYDFLRADSPEPGRDRKDGAESPTSVESSASPLTLAVYLDERGMNPAHRNRVFRDLETFVVDQRLDGPDWILGRFRNRFEVLAGPTKDQSLLARALASIDKPDSKSIEWQLAERRALAQIRDNYQACETAPFCVPCVDNWEQMVALARTHAAKETERMVWTTRGLADLIGSMSGLPGRKCVLYVGDGFEQRAGMATFAYLADLCDGPRPTAQNEMFQTLMEYDNTTRMMELSAYANGNRVTLYMLDAQGVHAGRRSGVEFADAKLAPSTINDRVRMDNLQGTHFTLANETGGAAILNTNRPLEALTDVAQQWTDASYSLGFQPPHPASGRSHQIRVELVGKAAKGRRIRYRRSYQDKRLEARLVDRLATTLYLGREVNPLGVEVSHGAPELIKRDLYQVAVEIRLPRAAFLRLPDNGDPRGQARVWMSAVADDGARSAVRQTLIDIDPPAEGGDIQSIVVRIELGEGDHQVAVGVRDELAQTETLLTLPIRVEEAGA